MRPSCAAVVGRLARRPRGGARLGARLLAERDDEDPLRAEADGGRERHVLADAAVDEPGALDRDRPEEERDRARRRGRAPARCSRARTSTSGSLAPARQRRAALDEHDRAPRAEVRRRHRERVEEALAHVPVEPRPVDAPLDEPRERLGPEEVGDAPGDLAQPRRAELAEHVERAAPASRSALQWNTSSSRSERHDLDERLALARRDRARATRGSRRSPRRWWCRTRGRCGGWAPSASASSPRR